MLTLGDHLGSSPEFVDWTNPVNRAHPLNRGLVSWWMAVPNRMGWGSLTWKDMCRKNDGTLNGMTGGISGWQGSQGRRGGNASVGFQGTFLGSDDYVNCGNGSSLNASSVVTVSCWVKKFSASANEGFVCKWYTGADASSCFLLYGGQDAANDKISFGIKQSDLTAVTHVGTVSVSTNWTHLCGVADGSKVRLYINGVEDGSGTSYDGTLNTTSRSLVLGRLRTDDTTYPFRGRMDSIRISGTAFTASEVRALYREESAYCQNTLNRVPLAFMTPQAAAVSAFVKLTGYHQSLAGCGGLAG